ncbi:FAD-dependent oxidoreductase [Streptacidiphilus rugosus]|uniref:FAD-dependent oxidoreductase n=1 Tax=Streptacidiphilus rugosus TaxID=405783 RepID=UPI00068F1746|nr:hypothetical protein [Streptacidiphilus rugosus]
MIVGGSFAGLVAARVLADHFDEVVLVEQDEVTDETGVHPHTPQGHHAHAMLARGAEVLEGLFPGLRAELARLGAPVYEYGERINFLLPTGFAPRCETGVLIQSFTRGTLERTLRRRVLESPRVVALSSVRCEALVSARAGAVTGVRYRPVGGGGESVVLDADLVVDASGRAGGLDERLGALGVVVPAPRVLDGRVTYASLNFPRTRTADFDVAYQMTFAPGIARGGVLVAVEGDRWTCSLLGHKDQAPPVDAAGYLGFARSLGNPRLADHLTERSEAERVHRYTHVHSRWNQYHRGRGWPERLVVVGDAVAAFNPVYGQGLTVAALEAELLRRSLSARHSRGGGLDGVSRPFQRGVAGLVRGPWTLSGSSDLMWDQRKQPLTARISHWYNRRLLAAAVDDPKVWTRFVRVINMSASPGTLFHPTVVAKIVRTAVLTRAAPTARR